MFCAPTVIVSSLRPAKRCKKPAVPLFFVMSSLVVLQHLRLQILNSSGLVGFLYCGESFGQSLQEGRPGARGRGR